MVVIEDVDMPKNCAECNCFLCKYHSKIWMIDNKCYQDSRHPSCPIKEFDYKSVLEDIKAEIENLRTEDVEFTHGFIQDGVLKGEVLAIIDNHINGVKTDGYTKK